MKIRGLRSEPISSHPRVVGDPQIILAIWMRGHPSRRQWKTHADDLRIPRMRLRRRKSGDFDLAVAAKTRCRARWGRRMDPLELPIRCRGGRRWPPRFGDRAGEAVGAAIR